VYLEHGKGCKWLSISDKQNPKIEANVVVDVLYVSVFTTKLYVISYIFIWGCFNAPNTRSLVQQCMKLLGDRSSSAPAKGYVEDGLLLG